MKKISGLFLLLLIMNARSYSQVVTVLDAYNLQPVEDVEVSANGSAKHLFTDAFGKVDISPLGQASELRFSRLGFEPITLTQSQLEAQGLTVKMTMKYDPMKTVVIAVNKVAEKKDDVAHQVEIITARDISFRNPSNMADALQQTGEVFVQRSQLGGGSPIIRGFEASRVLIAVDGIRMNNAIFRAGHLQNILTLDPAIVERTEVVFGPGSVMYGSDALGGVMHIQTRNPMLKTMYGTPTVSGNAYARLGSAAAAKTFHVDLNFAGKLSAALFSFTLNDFGDLRQGAKRKAEWGTWGKSLFYADRINNTDTMIANSSPDIQRGSGYGQIDVLAKWIIRTKPNSSHLFNFQLSTSTNVPRYDRLTEYQADSTLSYAQWYYGPQNRYFASYTFRSYAPTKLYDGLKVIAGFQHFDESRHSRRFGSSNLAHRVEGVNAFSVNLVLEKRKGSHEFNYGLEGIYNLVTSTAERENIVTNATQPLDTRYPDGGSNMSWAGVYFTHNWEIGKKWIVTDGVRLNYVTLHSTFSDTTFYQFPFTEANQKQMAPNGNLGLIWKPTENWKISLLGASGFRAPNVDDLTKVFESSPGRVVIPNPDLKPEYSWNGELGIQKKFGTKVVIEGVGFYTLYTNALSVAPGQFNGQDSILYDGVLSGVTQVVNADNGSIIGASGRVRLNLTRYFQLSSTLTYTKGTLESGGVEFPLDHIAPIFGSTALTFNFKSLQAEAWAQYSGPKDIDDFGPAGEDNPQYALPEGYPGWMTMNLRLSYALHPKVMLQAGVENIMDQFYRTFASGLSAPGRNFLVTVRAKI